MYGTMNLSKVVHNRQLSEYIERQQYNETSAMCMVHSGVGVASVQAKPAVGKCMLYRVFLW